MAYMNLTPRWSELMTTFRFLVESVTTRDRPEPRMGKDPNTVMQNFWSEMTRMAEGADRYGDLLAFLRESEGWNDNQIENALNIGRNIKETKRNTVHEEEVDG